MILTILKQQFILTVSAGKLNKMNKKIFYYLIVLLLVAGSITMFIRPALARRAGTVYYSKEVTGFPCGGLCSAQGIGPLGSEAGCPYECKVVWSPSCSDSANPSWPYVDYFLYCMLTADCGCDMVDPHCPGNDQHCESSKSGYSGGSCGGASCCPVAQQRSYTQCIKCWQHFNSSGALVNDNMCAKFLSGECPDDPCPVSCPAVKCEVFDKNDNGTTDRSEDYKDYRCVPKDQPAAKAALGSAEEAGVIIVEDSDCKCLVDSGQATWCPTDKQKGCCPKGRYCCGSGKYSVCCRETPPQEGCKGTWVPGFPPHTIYHCIKTGCPNPEFPKFCPAENTPRCCKKDDACGEFPHGVAYCKDPKCTPDSPTYCAPGLCCTPLETCTENYGVFQCIPKDCPPDKFLCPGIKQNEGQNTCCIRGKEKCWRHPNGYPYCDPIN